MTDKETVGQGGRSDLRANLDSPGYLKTGRLGAELMSRLLRWWQPSAARPARLALVARISIGPNQAVSLVEAEGRQLLVATSADGSPAFYPLHSGPKERLSVETSNGLQGRPGRRTGIAGRVSW